jgi:hypothetical protein
MKVLLKDMALKIVFTYSCISSSVIPYHTKEPVSKQLLDMTKKKYYKKLHKQQNDYG